MTARPVTGGSREPGDPLRELLIDTIAQHAASWESDSQDFVDAADAVLALPEVAELIADAAKWRGLDRPGPDYDGDDTDLLLDI